MTSGVEFVSAEQIFEILRPREAVAAIEATLRGGFDPAQDPPRTIVNVEHGQVLLMPSQSDSAVGTKVATVAPANPESGLDKIQALYIHFDAVTLTPRLLLDGTALTTLRTPAVSLAAISPALLRTSAPANLVVFGAGPQGLGHVATLLDVVDGHREVGSISHVVREPSRVPSAQLDPRAELLAAGSHEAARAVSAADVIVCATGSATPLFTSTTVRDDVIVVAVGSHDADRREVDAALCARAQVVVEDPATALRECGDVIIAIAEGALDAAALIPMSDVVAGRISLDSSRPVFFKGSGMAWQDVTVAQAVGAKREQVCGAVDE